MVIIDTSGRLSNNFELIEELKDMKAAIQSRIPTAPHETLLVVDGSVGRNAVDQAKAWTKYVGVSGLVVTKMDGTARGGFVVSVSSEIGIPVKLIGVGERIEDLRDFDAEVFVDALLGNDEKTSAKLKERADKMMGNLAALSTISAVSSSSPSSDSTSRLKDSFKSTKVSSDVSITTKVAEDGKPKRRKRPPPQKKK